MTTTLFILNDAPYGNERAYNGLRLAGALAAKEGQSVRLFLMADCVFRRSVTDRFGGVTAEFGSVTGDFGDVTDGRLVPA